MIYLIPKTDANMHIAQPTEHSAIKQSRTCHKDSQNNTTDVIQRKAQAWQVHQFFISDPYSVV